MILKRKRQLRNISLECLNAAFCVKKCWRITNKEVKRNTYSLFVRSIIMSSLVVKYSNRRSSCNYTCWHCFPTISQTRIYRYLICRAAFWSIVELLNYEESPDYNRTALKKGRHCQHHIGNLDNKSHSGIPTPFVILSRRYLDKLCPTMILIR